MNPPSRNPRSATVSVMYCVLYCILCKHFDGSECIKLEGGTNHWTGNNKLIMPKNNNCVGMVSAIARSQSEVVLVYVCTISCQKYFHGAFVRIFNFYHAYALPPCLATLIHIRSTVGAYWKNGSFSECVLQEINDTFVDTKHRRHRILNSRILKWTVTCQMNWLYTNTWL